MKICVLGAGIVGLTTALQVQSEFPNAEVYLIAENFTTDTTSDVAAGIFRPSTSFSGPTEEITQKWIVDAYEYWDEIRKSADAPLAGVAQLSGYIFSSISPHIVKNKRIEKVVAMHRSVTDDELTICPGNWKYGSFFTTLIAESGLYLPYAGKKFQDAGGRVISQRIENFSELFSKYDYVINCTGLGAKYLCNDPKLVPIRGQLIKVHAPWLKMAFYGDFDTYIVPGFEGVTLGGCRNFESYSMDISRHDSAGIRERCESMVPSLRQARVIRERVGLRPHRDPTRVEPEILRAGGKRLNIIHNYGHGGYGVTTSPGTAKYAVSLLRDMHSGNSKL